MLSLGLNDQCLFQWKVSLVTTKSPNIAGKKKNNIEDQGSKIFVTDESLVNEVNFCYVSPTIENENDNPEQEIVDKGVLIRGCNDQTMNRLRTKLNFSMEEEVWKRPPTVALVLEHIYGVQTSDRRHTVTYMHFHGDKIQEQQQTVQSLTSQLGIVGSNNSRLDQVLPKLLGPNFQKLLDPAQQIKYDNVHKICHKNLVYFTSRFGIVFSPNKNAQTFYQGHSLKISCIIKHPLRRLIATGDVAIQPFIHIWDASTLEPQMVLQTSHRGGVLLMAFSPDGRKIVSIGMDRAFSVQIFQWEQNKTLAFRNLGFLPVFAVKFYPFENSKFVTCGYQHMAIWRLQGNHLTCLAFSKYESQKINTQQLNVPLRSVLMSLDFLNYRLGFDQQSDILFGTSEGEITTYCSGKHFILNQNAHKGSINCLLITDKLNDNVNIVTGGEDGFIKIWDSSVVLLQSIDIREVSFILKDFKNQRSFGIQSLEMYCCDKQSPKRILVGIRCGEILEAIITDQSGKPQQQSIQRESGETKIGLSKVKSAMLNFEFFTIISSHSSLSASQGQKKIACVVNPELPILASVGDDETLRFWDLIKKQIIVSKYLGTQATALAYSPDSAFLVIGLINGIILVLEAKIMKLQYGTYLEEYTMPTLDIVMSPKEAKAAVTCIKFSYKGDYLAVGFNNEFREDNLNKSVNQTQAEYAQRDPSFIIIYVNRLSQCNPGIKLNSMEPYVKLIKILVPLNDFQPSASIRKQLAVTSFDFSVDNNFLQIQFQKINQENIIDTETYQFGESNIFVIWDINKNELFTNFEALNNTQWPDWSMAPAINARYIGAEINLQDGIAERQLLFRELLFMSKVQRFVLQPNAICGSHSGGLFLFRFDSLVIDKKQVTDFKFDLIKKKDMAATRGFYAHTSMIQSLEIFEDKTVLSSSVSDQCICQWKVEFEDKHWDLDFNDVLIDHNNLKTLIPQQPQDPYHEFMIKEKFDKCLLEIWSQRLVVAEINQGVLKTDYDQPACEFDLQYIIGRRAFDRRMNIKIDCMDRITYQASSIQVFLTENDEQDQALIAEGLNSRIKQEFLRPDGNRYKSVSPELSTFCYSKDARILFVATAQTIANVYIWEITINMKLGEFSVPNVPIITNLKVSHDNKHVLILGVTKEYFQMMTMVDWTKGNKVLFTRQFLHSITCKIRDIEFYPNSTMNFITAGIQHLCFWKLSGNNLEYQVGEFTILRAFSSQGKGACNTNPQNHGRYGLSLITGEKGTLEDFKDRNRNMQDDDLENLFVTFLNIIWVGDTLITSGDDGFLYLWEKFRIIRRIFAHEGAITALHANSKLGLIVSGGMEGVVTLWRLLTEQKSNVKSLERLKTYNLRKGISDPQIAVQKPECNVQSVCLGFNRIIVGMRTGSIHEVVISEDRKIIKPHYDIANDQVKRWLSCADHQVPKSVGIDMTSSRIYTITSGGLFSVWDLVTFDVIYQKNYEKDSKFLQAFRLTNKVMLVFDFDILVVDSDPKLNSFKEKTDYSIVVNQITYATINQDETILGVATITSAQPEITLFATDGGFIKIKQIVGFSSSIKYLDFSTDNYFMQVEDSVGEVHLYELENDKVHPNTITFELEWLGEGLRSYSRLRGLKHQYNNNNKIVRIKKLLGKPIVVIADELGTLRLFNYPNVKGELYYKSYSDHLFTVSDCLFSPDRLFFISSCENDRCVFKWKMKLNDDKIMKLVEKDMTKGPADF